MARLSGSQLPVARWMLVLAVGLGACTPSSEPASTGSFAAARDALAGLAGPIETADPETIRAAAYRAIDLYAQALKWKVDAQLLGWSLLSPEQRKAVVQQTIGRVMAFANEGATAARADGQGRGTSVAGGP
jgi:hypothetical protein